jgi:hypothetical protein
MLSEAVVKTDDLTRCANNPAGALPSNSTFELKPKTPLLVVQTNHHGGMREDFTG